MGTCLVAPSLGDTVALLGLHSGWPEALRGWRRWRGGQEKLNLSHNTKVCIVHRPARGAFGYFGGWSSKTCPHPHIHLLPSLLHCCLFHPSEAASPVQPPSWDGGHRRASDSHLGDGTSHARGVPHTHWSYLGVHPLGAGGRVLHPAVEVHRQHVLRTGFLPGVAVPEPVVGFFHLPRGSESSDRATQRWGHLHGLCHVEGGWERLRKRGCWA